MATFREAIESPLAQGADERVSYIVTTTPWGSAPSQVTVVAYDVTTAREDVSATVLLGDPSVEGDVITTPIVRGLQAGHRYRIEVQFTTGGSVYECFFVLQGED